MRLIDADLQYDKLADELKWLMQYGDDVYLAVTEALRKEPTAYDIDKVVEELESAENYYYHDKFDEEGDLIMFKSIEQSVAIEIVKQGGVRKDVNK